MEAPVVPAPDLPLVSADSHVVEPADVWTSRLGSRYGERAPRVVVNHGGRPGATFVCEDVPPFGIAAFSGADIDPDDLPTHFTAGYERVRPGGWDATVSATAFRMTDDPGVRETIASLNAIQGHPFLGEDCTAFIERAFGGRRMFADSPLLRSFGIGARIGDPALPLLKPDAPLDQDTRQKLQFDQIKDLPDALADAESPNVRIWLVRLTPIALLAVLAKKAYSSSSRKSTPASITARRFFK